MPITPRIWIPASFLAALSLPASGLAEERKFDLGLLSKF